MVLLLKSKLIEKLIKGMDSFEEQVLMFMDEQYYYSNESELKSSVEDLWWENNSNFDDSPERNLYWESQVALLQVLNYSSIIQCFFDLM